MRELDAAEVDSLLSDVATNRPGSQSREVSNLIDSRTGKPVKRKFNYDDRTVSGWFKLPHHRGECEIPQHNEEEHPRDAMVAELPDGRKTCRRCFVGKLDK